MRVQYNRGKDENALIDLTKGARRDFGGTYFETKTDKLVQERKRANKSSYKKYREIILWPGNKNELEEITGKKYDFLKPRDSHNSLRPKASHKFFASGSDSGYLGSSGYPLAYESLLDSIKDKYCVDVNMVDAIVHYRQQFSLERGDQGHPTTYLSGVPVIKSKRGKKKK